MDNNNTITLHEYIKSKGQIECLCPILCFLITFYSVYEVKCDQNVEYGTIKSLIVRISPLYDKEETNLPNKGHK